MKNRESDFKRRMQVPNKPKIPTTNMELEERRARRRAKRRRRELIGKMAKGITAIGASALVLLSGGKAIANYVDGQNTASLDDMLKHGETLKELGINEEIKTELDQIRQELSESGDLSNAELQKLSTKVSKLQENVLKTKLSSALNTDNIIISYETDKDLGITTQIKAGDEKYVSESVQTIFNGEQTMGQEIKDYIYNQNEVEDLAQSMTKEDINRGEIINRLNQAVNEIDKFAAGELELEENGDITLSYVRQSELNQENKENSGEER